MIDFLFSLSLWTLAIVLNVWLIGFSLASLWALRRWIVPRLHINTDASLFYGAAVWDFHVSAKVVSPTIRRAHPHPAEKKEG